ncbi:MAG: hypothetical protein ACYTG0_41715, partial [Planctomycetota bacterium]
MTAVSGDDKSVLWGEDGLFQPTGSAGVPVEETGFAPDDLSGVFVGGPESQSAAFHFTFDGTPEVQQT